MAWWKRSWWDLLGIPKQWHAWATLAYLAGIYAVVLAFRLPLAPWNHAAWIVIVVAALAWALASHRSARQAS